MTITAAGKVELSTEEGEDTVQNRGENVTYYLAWGYADLSHPSNRYRDDPEQKDYDWAQWRLNIAAGMVVVGSVTILGAVVAGAAAGAGLIAAGNVSAGSAAASVGGAVFLTGSLYVAEQAVSDAVSGRLGDTEKYVRKALAGSAVGFLTGASGLMMQGASLGKVLSLGFGEGFLGSAAAQGLLNEDGEINWALAIGDGMFLAVMAGLVWKHGIIGETNEFLNCSNGDVIDYIEATPRLNGTLYDPKELKQLERYLNKRGIQLRVGDEFLPPNKAGGFDAVSGILYLRSNPTQYEVWHEVSHYIQYQRLGKEAYLKLPRTMGKALDLGVFNAPEQFVYDMLSNNSRRWGLLSLEEQMHANWYITYYGEIR